MRHLRTYRLFEEISQDEIDRIEYIMRSKIGTREYTVQPGGVVDVHESVSIRERNLNRLPVRFGKIDGDFDCSKNQLTSLEGAPHTVSGSFSCARNRLTSLEGAPKKASNFYCYGNELTSLKGCPEVQNMINASNNRLTSLEGAPKKLDTLNCSQNRLTSLNGAPLMMLGNFDCSNNLLETLDGSPGLVKNYVCRSNRLTDLRGVSPNISGNLNCSDNNITSLEGLGYAKSLTCGSNPVPDDTLQSVFEVMRDDGIGYMEALGVLHERGELKSLKGFEGLSGVEQIIPDLRGKVMGNKFGI